MGAARTPGADLHRHEAVGVLCAAWRACETPPFSDFHDRADNADDNRAHTGAAVLSFAVTMDDARTAQVKRSPAPGGRRTLDNLAARLAQPRFPRPR